MSSSKLIEIYYPPPSLTLQREKPKTLWGQDSGISKQSLSPPHTLQDTPNPATQLSQHPQGSPIIWLVPCALLVKITHAKLCFSSSLTGNFPSFQRDFGSDGSPCWEQGFKNKACDILSGVLARLCVCLPFHSCFVIGNRNLAFPIAAHHGMATA